MSAIGKRQSIVQLRRMLRRLPRGLFSVRAPRPRRMRARWLGRGGDGAHLPHAWHRLRHPTLRRAHRPHWPASRLRHLRVATQPLPRTGARKRCLPARAGTARLDTAGRCPAVICYFFNSCLRSNYAGCTAKSLKNKAKQADSACAVVMIFA